MATVFDRPTGYDKPPGYAGYNRRYNREMVTVMTAPQNKYEQVAPNHRSLANDTMYQTMYMQEQGPKSRAVVQPKGTAPRSLGGSRALVAEDKPLTRGLAKRIGRNPKTAENERIRQEAFTHRPTNWGTTYQGSFDGWKTSTVSRHIGIDTLGRNVTVRSLEPSATSYRDTFKYNQIRKEKPQTTYQRDHGDVKAPPERFGAPGSRDVYSAVSACATSSELFKGTTKGHSTSRLPGYGGFVPASSNNHHHVQRSVFPTLKDHLRSTYRHDMPGYTGHKPQSVVNDSGPRDPHTLADNHDGRLQVSLVLESMGRKPQKTY